MTNIVQNLENLILASSLVERSRPAKLVEILRPNSFQELFAHRWNTAELTREAQTALERLAAQELLEIGKTNALRLTESGKERARIFLTPRKLAKKLSWEDSRGVRISIRKGYLPAKALGISEEIDDAGLRRLGKADHLRAELLRRRFAIDFPPAPPLAELLEEVAWLLLERGASPKVIEAARKGKSFKSWKRIMNALFCSAAGRDFDQNRGADLLAAAALEVDDPDAGALYRELGRWAVEGRTFGLPEKNTHDLDDSRFAEEVRRIAESIDDGRVEDQLVFVSHVWRRLTDEGVAIPLDRFKQRLVDAYRADRISLAKADMPQTLNPRDLDESEIIDRNTIFSFIRI